MRKIKVFDKKKKNHCDDAVRRFSVHPISVIVWIWLWVVLGFSQAISYFFAILLHELGHYFTAKKKGYALSKFSLSPYGVELSYFQQNMNFRDEFWIALAGPAVNLISAFLVVGLWWIFPISFYFTESFVLISVLLALFNLLPAYPLDGGRIFVSTASNLMSEKMAKKITMLFNLVLCTLFVILFVVFCFVNFNPTYFLFAFFLICGFLDLKFATRFEKVNIFCKKTKNFVKPTIFVVYPDTKIKDLICKIQASKTFVFMLVLDNGRIVTLSEKMIVNLSLNYDYDCCLKEIFK